MIPKDQSKALRRLHSIRSKRCWLRPGSVELVACFYRRLIPKAFASNRIRELAGLLGLLDHLELELEIPSEGSATPNLALAEDA